MTKTHEDPLDALTAVDAEPDPVNDPARLHLDDLQLPSGEGYVRFADPYSLTGAHVEQMRKAAGASPNQGVAGNLFMWTAISYLVDAWEIAYLPHAPIPRADIKILRRLKALDLRAIERHITPVLDELTGRNDKRVDDGSPGSPLLPASE